MDDTPAPSSAEAIRRSVLGDEYVDAMVHDSFPEHVLSGRYASGFTSSLMAKDGQLYLRAVDEQGSARAVGAVTAAIWERFAAEEPGADFTRIFPFFDGS